MSTTEPKMGRPRDPSRDAAILAATLDLLGEVGYEQVTVRAIAERAGVGLATMYRRWPTKEQLIVDAVGAFDPTERLRPRADPAENLVNLVSGLVEILQGPRHGLIANLIGRLPTNPELADALRTNVIRPRLNAVIAELRRVPGVDPSAAAEAAELIPAAVFFRVHVLGRRVTKRDVRQLVHMATRLATGGARAQ